MPRSRNRLLRRHAALPDDHGSWVFLLSPLLVGLAAGGRWHTVSAYLVVASLAGFLVRQPVTMAVKVWSGRRSRESLPAALFWIAVYSLVGGLHVTGLVLRGHGYLLWLAVPGIVVFAVHLTLVARREERRQRFVEIAATGVLALTAPAGLWVGLGHPDPVGWLLWLLLWAQSAASILHAYMRLAQRPLPALPDLAGRLRLGAAALAATWAGVAVVVVLALAGRVPAWLFVPYTVQAVETLRGALVPACGLRPRAIGLRQLVVSVVFTVTFIVAWSLGPPPRAEAGGPTGPRPGEEAHHRGPLPVYCEAGRRPPAGMGNPEEVTS